MSYNANNNQYPYYPSNTYDQAPTSGTYGNEYAKAGQTSNQTSSYYQNDTYRTQSANQYGSNANANQPYSATSATQQQGVDNPSRSSMTYMGPFGSAQRLDYGSGAYPSTPTAQSGTMSYAPMTGYNSREVDTSTSAAGANSYSATSGFNQSASRSTAQTTSSRPQHPTYGTAHDTQSNMRSSNQTQQAYTRPYQTASREVMSTAPNGESSASSMAVGRASSYVSPTVATNPQLAQSHSKNAQPAATHHRTSSGLSQGQPSRPRSTVRQRRTPVPRPSSTDPSIVQSTMQQLANVPWHGHPPPPLPPPQTLHAAPPSEQTGASIAQGDTLPAPAADIGTDAGAQSGAQLVQEKPKKRGGRAKGAKDLKPRKSKSSLASPGQKDSSDAPSDKETELKAMFERMQELRQSDPGMFAQLWDTFKKPVSDRPSTDSAIPPHAAGQAPAVQKPTATTSAPQPVQSVPTAQLSSSSAVAQQQRSTTKKGKSTKRDANQPPATPSFIDLTDSSMANTQGRQNRMANDQSATSNPLPSYVSDQVSTTLPAGTNTASSAAPQGQTPATPAGHSQAPAGTTASALKSPTTKALPVQPGFSALGATIWPAGRRQGLASAVKRFLEAVPENKGKVVDPDNIQELLNQNPSYDKLCQIMEGQGWIFRRKEFAEELFAVINRGNQPGGRSVAAANMSRPLVSPTNTTITPGEYHVHPGQYQHTPHQPRSPPATSSDPHLAASSATAKATAPITTATPADEALSSATPRFFDASEPSSVALPETTAPSKPASRSRSAAKPIASSATLTPAPEPRNKEEAARKRTFADFVDLTEQDEDEDVEMELERERKRQALEKPADRFVEKASQEGSTPWQQAAQRFDRFRNQPMMTGMTSARDALRNETVVRAINAARAKRTSRYDPRTIARDFFLAKGEHPTMKPLNHHYEALFNTFKTVKIDADLETFRWDLVDPGEPAPDPERDLEKAERKAMSEGDAGAFSAQTKNAHGQTPNNGYEADSDSDERVVGTLISSGQDTSKRDEHRAYEGPADAGNSAIVADAPHHHEHTRPIVPAVYHQRSSTSRGGMTRAPSATARGSWQVTGVHVPPIPRAYMYTQAEPSSGSNWKSRTATTPDSFTQFERAPIGRPPISKRGRPRGRPSRGSRVQHDTPHQGPTLPDNSGPTPPSFTPVNTPRGSVVRIGTLAASNAIDDLSATGLTASVESPNHSSTPMKRGPGRPPIMATPLSFSVVVPSTGAPLDAHGNPAKISSTGKRVGRPPGSKNKSGSGLSASDTGSPSVRASSEGPLKRKPGRPLGYRPSIHGRGPGASRGIGRGRGRGRGRVRAAGAGRPRAYKRPTTFPRDDIGVVIPQLDLQRLELSLSYVEPLTMSKPRDPKWGKDDSSHHRDVSKYPDTGHYPVFQCRWHGCTSQLHNFETLRKHTEMIHLKPFSLEPATTPECLWFGCCADSHLPGEIHEKHASARGGIQFDDLADLEKHVATEHMKEISWRQGDGPTVHPKTVDPSTYLNDPSNQRIIVPTALRPGTAPPDPLLDLTESTIPRDSRVQFIKGYHKAHGNLTRASKARAALLSRQAWAEDEDRLSTQGENNPRKWKQMNMTGVRVEIPLSEEAALRLGLQDRGVDAWRDGDWRCEGSANVEVEDEDEEGNVEGSDDAEGSEMDTDGQAAAAFTSPGRAGRMGTGMLAPKTIMATGPTAVRDSDDEDDGIPMITFTSPGRSGAVGTGMLASSTIAASGPSLVSGIEEEGSDDNDNTPTKVLSMNHPTIEKGQGLISPTLLVPGASMGLSANEEEDEDDEMDEDSSGDETAAVKMLNKPASSETGTKAFASRPRVGNVIGLSKSIFGSGSSGPSRIWKSKSKSPAPKTVAFAETSAVRIAQGEKEDDESSEDDYYDAQPPIASRKGEQ